MMPSFNFDLRRRTAKVGTALGASRASLTALGASEDGAGEAVALPDPVPPVPPVEPTSNLPFYLDPTTRQAVSESCVSFRFSSPSQTSDLFLVCLVISLGNFCLG